MKFSTNKEVFHKQKCFPCFPQTKIFRQANKYFANKDENFLMLGGNKRS